MSATADLLSRVVDFLATYGGTSISDYLGHGAVDVIHPPTALLHSDVLLPVLLDGRLELLQIVWLEFASESENSMVSRLPLKLFENRTGS